MSEIQKPFARWASFQDCVDEMMQTQHHDKESAGAICHSIEVRAEKGMLYKGSDSIEVIKSKNGEMIVVGPASWEVADLEVPTPDYVTVDAQKSFLKKFFEMPEEYRNISIDHQSLIIGKAVLKAIGDDGHPYYSHVHEKGTVLVSKIRSDVNLGWVQKYREEIKQGIYKMYSIRASNAVRVPATVDNRRVNKIMDMDPIEVGIVKTGTCPKAGPLDIVAKKSSLVSKIDNLSKMTWEECIAEASADPDVDDPEALCGWLKAHGPNVKSAEKDLSKLTIEEHVKTLLAEAADKIESGIKKPSTQLSQQELKPDLDAQRIFNKYFPDKKEAK